MDLTPPAERRIWRRERDVMIHREVESKLRTLGLTGCYQGYACLVYAAMLVDREPEALEMPSKLIYPEIARLCRLTVGGVDQAIRTAIQVCCRRGGDEVSRMCGTEGTPSVEQFLAGLASYCGGRQR